MIFISGRSTACIFCSFIKNIGNSICDDLLHLKKMVPHAPNFSYSWQFVKSVRKRLGSIDLGLFLYNCIKFCLESGAILLHNMCQ